MKYWYMSIFIAISTLAISYYSLSLKNAYLFTESDDFYSIGKDISYFFDSEEKYTIEDVSTPSFDSQFIKSKREYPALKLQNGAVWIKFSLNHNPFEGQETFLSIYNNFIQLASLYTHNRQNNSFEIKTTGRSVPMAERDVLYTFPTFPIEIDEELKNDYYLKLKSDGPLTIHTYIANAKFVEKSLKDRSYVNGIYLGVIFVMIFYNLSLFFLIRDKLHLLYVCSIFFLNGIYISTIYGFLDPYLFPSVPWFQERVFLCSRALGFYFFLAFSQNFLLTKSNQILNKMANFTKFTCLFFFVLSLFSRHPYIILLLNIAVVPTLIVLVIYSGKIFFQGKKFTRFYFISWFPLIIATVVNSFVHFTGIFASPNIPLFLLFGSIFETALNSMALGDRFNLIREENKRQKEETIKKINNLNQELQKELKERKQTEALLKKEKLKAEQASLAKTHFIANINHELRTPLSGMKGFTELLREDISKSSTNPTTKMFIDQIKKNTDKVQSLIEDILSVVDFEIDAIILHKESFNLADLVDCILVNFQLSANQKPIQINFKKHDIGKIYADKRRLRQVLSHIVFNAIKFQKSKGEVTIELQKNNGELNLSIEDSGIGIDTKDQKFIFDLFHQLDSSFSRSYEGLGLGLYLCKKIVEAHEGTIDFHSKKGVGSTISIRLPIETSYLHPKAIP